MFTDLCIKDFKSITMEDPIKLKGLSILCGSNSSGKSSVIQTLLLLCQSFSGRYQDEPITLNGYLTRLGAYRDIKSYFPKEDGITISFILDLKEGFYGTDERKIVKHEITFGVTSWRAKNRDEEYHPVLLRNKLVVMDSNNEGDMFETERVCIEKINAKSSDSKRYVVTEFKSSEENRINAEYPDYTFVESSRCELTPTTLFIEYDYLKKISAHVINHATNYTNAKHIDSNVHVIESEYQVLPREFMNEILNLVQVERQEIYDSISLPESMFESIVSNEDEWHDKFRALSVIKHKIVNSTYFLDSSIIPHDFFIKETTSLKEWREFITRLEEKPRKALLELIDKNRTLLQSLWCESMPPSFKKAPVNIMSLYEIDSLLNLYFTRSVKYLGPLRLEPQAIYSSLGQNDPLSVGLKGEFTAAVLHRNKDKVIRYLSPKIINGDLTLETKKSKLRYACLEWLSYLGVIVDFYTRDRGKLGYELMVKTNSNEKWQDLTHVGVGVSQVLPVILMFLLSDEDDVMIFEQPELHLHPLVQSRLCDLFIAMANSNRQCIIETHSEYLINRLRLRIAQETNENIINNTSMFFITKDEGYSNFTQIEINKYGNVIDWPKDFFDQTDREIENILLEAGKKRKKDSGIKRNIRFEVKDARDN